MSVNPNALVCLAVPFLVLAAVAAIFTVPSLLRRLRVRRRMAAMFAGPSRPGQQGVGARRPAPTLRELGDPHAGVHGSDPERRPPAAARALAAGGRHFHRGGRR